jgi:hypothetical protein
MKTSYAKQTSGQSLNSILYDAWESCSGDWNKSKFLMNIRERHIKRCKGTRKWLFAWEMDQRFGAQIGEQMRVRKEENAELSQREIRYHPELDKTEGSLVV